MYVVPNRNRISRSRVHVSSVLAAHVLHSQEAIGQEDPVWVFGSFYRSSQAMDRVARKVAARWGLTKVSSASAIPGWVVAWGDAWAAKLASRVALFSDLPGYNLSDQEVFAQAQESLHILLPKFQALLYSKLQEKFSASISRSGTRSYYFFSSDGAMETFALTLVVRRGVVDLVLGYVPIGISGHPDYSKAVEEHERVIDPEMAGLSLMRVTRKIFNLI